MGQRTKDIRKLKPYRCVEKRDSIWRWLFRRAVKSWQDKANQGSNNLLLIKNCKSLQVRWNLVEILWFFNQRRFHYRYLSFQRSKVLYHRPYLRRYPLEEIDWAEKHRSWCSRFSKERWSQHQRKSCSEISSCLQRPLTDSHLFGANQIKRYIFCLIFPRWQSENMVFWKNDRALLFWYNCQFSSS